MRRVLVTRPEPDASATATRLAEAGFEPVLMPLTRIEPLTVEPVSDIGGFEAVAVASANAVRHAPASLLAALAGKPCYAVGKRTAEVARRAGLSIAATAGGNAAMLAERIIADMPTPARILLLCGRVRTDTLSAALRRPGLTTAILETYDTLAVAYDDEQAAAILGEAPIRAALAYSVNGAKALDALARGRFAKTFTATLFLCMSTRIAAALGSHPPEGVRVAAEPSEEAMLTLLKSEA